MESKKSGSSYTAASDRKRGSSGRAHHIGIKKNDNHGDIIVKMPPHAPLYLLQIRVSHLSLLRGRLQCHFHKSTCNTVSWVVLNNVNSFLVPHLFPQSVRSQNQKPILWLDHMLRYRRLPAQDWPLHRLTESILCVQRFPVELRLLKIHVTYGSRYLNNALDAPHNVL